VDAADDAADEMNATFADPGADEHRRDHGERSDEAGESDPPSAPSEEPAREARPDPTPAGLSIAADGIDRTAQLSEPAARAGTPIHARIPRIVRTKPIRVAAWFLAIAALPFAHPKLAALRLLALPGGPNDPAAALEGPTGIEPEYGELALAAAHNEAPPIVAEQAEEAQAPLVIAPAASASVAKPSQPVLADVAVAVGATYRPIEDPSGHAMDAFFASLARTEEGAPGAVTRVAHYGDSLIVSDFMSSTLRRRFQARFGDAGHGFVLLAKPWAWYFHQDVHHWSSDGWRVHRVVNPRVADELYGYGGATFVSREGGTKASFGTAKSVAGDPTSEKEAFGRRVSRFDVHYLAQEGGGAFDLLLDGRRVETVDSRLPPGAGKKLSVATVRAPDGEHALEIRTIGSGEARLFGVALERDVPGVVWDALGVNGGRARILDVNDDAHWAEALRARAPSLVILQYGTNESEDTGYPQAQYEASLEAVLSQVRRALPDASCLVVGPMDRAGAGSGGLETRPIILQLDESQRRVAAKVGCAFWDTFLAMGGSGAMGRWVKATPKLGGGDLTHPTAAGAALLGDLLYTALLNGYLERR
jgi:lysophospholipase L1-like esterase